MVWLVQGGVTTYLCSVLAYPNHVEYQLCLVWPTVGFFKSIIPLEDIAIRRLNDFTPAVWLSNRNGYSFKAVKYSTVLTGYNFSITSARDENSLYQNTNKGLGSYCDCTRKNNIHDRVFGISDCCAVLKPRNAAPQVSTVRSRTANEEPPAIGELL
jgi:hypothetical protein